MRSALGLLAMVQCLHGFAGLRARLLGRSQGHSHGYDQACLTSSRALRSAPRMSAEEDVEGLRARLEKCLTVTVSDIKTLDQRELHTAAPEPREHGVLTLNYEQALMTLLGDAAEDGPRGDAIQQQLWTLWFSERGQDAKEELEAAIRLMERAEPMDWEQAAIAFQGLAQRHPGWAEPINKLATLRFLQKDFQQSVVLCKQVLDIKPWHFGAISGITMGYGRLGDPDQFQHWGARVLPPAGTLELQGGKTLAPRATWATDMAACIKQKAGEHKRNGRPKPKKDQEED